MAETVRERINGYLEDAIAAERNFEDALHTFGRLGEQEKVQKLLSAAGDKARTQHERLTDLLKKRGGSPSEAKSVLAHLLALTPLTVQASQEPGERNTQHLIATYAAAAAEKAMYEALGAAAQEAGDSDVAQLARQLQSEEEDDAKQVWPLLERSGRESFEAAKRAGQKPNGIVCRYLDDAIGAEKSFETQLKVFSMEGDSSEAKSAFGAHAKETRSQHERLTARLNDLGGKPSTTKSLLAHLFTLTPQAAQIGHDATERTTQNLIIGCGVENAEVAMYEVFGVVAGDAGDHQTKQLVLDIQKQERETADKVWKLVSSAARKSIQAAAQNRAA